MSKSKMILPLGALTFLALTSRASDTLDTMAAMFRGDPAHTGVYSTAGKAKVQKERWRFKTGNMNRSTPVVMGGTVYVGSQTGILYALATASGNLKWERYCVGRSPGIRFFFETPEIRNCGVTARSDRLVFRAWTGGMAGPVRPNRGRLTVRFWPARQLAASWEAGMQSEVKRGDS